MMDEVESEMNKPGGLDQKYIIKGL